MREIKERHLSKNSFFDSGVMTMDVSIIMINYNTYELAKNAIESIKEHTTDIDYEILLIDNNSPDGSGKKLKEYFKEHIRYIQAEDNLGTSKSFNMGLRNAKGEFVLWLNTDILIRDNFVRTLYNYMSSHSDCGICGGNLVDGNEKPTHSFRMALPSLKTVSRDFSIIRNIFSKIFNTRIKQEYNFKKNPMKVGYITGADMMIRKSILDELHGFDEDIFMYSEECEFTFRMTKQTNYSVVSVPDAIMQHLEGRSFGDKNTFNIRRFTTKLNGDSVYFKKCYGENALLRFLKITKSGYKKLSILNKILLRFEKAKKYKDAVDIINQKIKEIG